MSQVPVNTNMEHTNGYYSVGNEIFANKLYASKRSLDIKMPLEWHYYDTLFDSVSKSNLGKTTLPELYKQRAQQLRDSYDFLVLYYSGGADSWNVLNTFLKNKIKLDCIFVQHPVSVKKTYIPNIIDESAANQFSEWDFVIKPDLEYISKYHPNIHIEIGDYTNNISSLEKSLENTLNDVTISYNVIRLLKMVNECQFEMRWLQQGKTVGCIYGVDKPNLLEKDGNCYYTFLDRWFSASINLYNPSGIEYFYITPNFPSLTIEQSLVLFNWYKANPNFRHLIKATSLRPEMKSFTQSQISNEFKIRHNICKTVLYDGWDSTKFQANKPGPSKKEHPEFIDWEEHLIQIPEYKNIGLKWRSHWNSFWTPNDKLTFKSEGELKHIWSKWHYLCAS